MTNTHTAATYGIEDSYGPLECRVATHEEAEALARNWLGNNGQIPNDVLWIVPGDGSAPTKVVAK